MTYRDDLEAAQARAAAAERRAAELQKRLDAVEEAEDAARPELPVPEGVRVDRQGDRVAVSWRWFRPAEHLTLLVFCIAWDAFLVFWYMTATSMGSDWIAIVFPIAHVAVGLGLTYTVLTGFCNRTTIHAGPSRLEVTHGPLPWLGNRRLARSDVRQVYATKDLVQGKHRTREVFHLCALMDGGSEVRLLKDVGSHARAQYFEHVIERALGIRDRPVVGEVEKPER